MGVQVCVNGGVYKPGVKTKLLIVHVLPRKTHLLSTLWLILALNLHHLSLTLASVSTAKQPSVSLMTDVTMETISRLELEYNTLREENQKVKLEIEGLKMPDKFLDNPSKVCYFTGLPSIAVLLAVFDFISVCASTSRSALPPFQQF